MSEAKRSTPRAIEVQQLLWRPLVHGGREWAALLGREPELGYPRLAPGSTELDGTWFLGRVPVGIDRGAYMALAHLAGHAAEKLALAFTLEDLLNVPVERRRLVLALHRWLDRREGVVEPEPLDLALVLERHGQVQMGCTVTGLVEVRVQLGGRRADRAGQLGGGESPARKALELVAEATLALEATETE